jgi:26S proteasome regulatory subunit N10
LTEDEAQLEELGKRLKRNNVNIDVINFANPENVAKLEAFVTTANKEDGSHFLDVPMGINMITDVLITSPICLPEEMGGGA